MLTLLFVIYILHCIRKILRHSYSWHCLSCGGNDTSEQENKYYEATAPMRQYQADMNQLFEQVYTPYTKDVYGKWSELGPKISADVANPWLDTKPIFENIWKRTRENTAAEYAPIERQTSQRLASTGALDTSGAALKMYGDIQQSKYKSLETQAIDQALQEFNIQNQAKQQSYNNMFQYLQGPGAVNALAGYRPELMPPYVKQDTSSNAGLLGGGAGALVGALLAAPTGGMSIPLGALIGSGIGYGAGSMVKY